MTEPDEEVLDAGRDTPRVLRLLGRPVPLVLGAGLIVAAVVITLAGTAHDEHSAASRTPTSIAGTSATSATSARPQPGQVSSSTDDELLLQVPAQDMLAILHTRHCRHGCIAHTVVGAELRRTGAGFAGLTPLAAGRITDAGGVYDQTVEARARPDALVHLESEHVRLPAASLRTTDSPGPGYRTVVLAVIRSGWRLTVTLIVRGTRPPVDAAIAWLRHGPLPG